ncbi:MAG TPA: SRPBCC family protein [Candidatus Sulfotelmatobacter sp.]|jgi:activator of HSP90 ATPase|nr:SRPBCC family protein [Candidatus Sulfotelmatobacter sp.]
MNTNSASAVLAGSTRRQVVAGIIAACSVPLFSGAAWGHGQDKMTSIPSTAANKDRTSLHQEIDYKAAPSRIYEALLSSKDFTAFSGLPAEIDPKVGGAFSMFGGLVIGRNVELVPNQRIVQAWRLSTEFPEGTYSLVKFELQAKDGGTRIVLDHTGFPEGHFDHLDVGWHSHYWDPLRKFLG